MSGSFVRIEAIHTELGAHLITNGSNEPFADTDLSLRELRTTFINFGGRYPNHVFYAVIFRKSQDQFSGIHALEGKAVAVSGTIEFYKGKPQIILHSPDQIELR